MSNLPFSTLSPHIRLKCSDGWFFQYNAVKGATVQCQYDAAQSSHLYDLIQCRTSFQYLWEIDEAQWTYGRPFKPVIGRWVGMVRQPKVDVKALSRRWNVIEDMLGLTERSVIHGATGEPSVAIWHLSPFWILTDTHRSFCTLFMRMLVVYGQDDLDQSIRSYHLANKIAPAVKWFLAGNTRPTYDRLTRKGINGGDGYTGVCNQFGDVTTPEQLAAVLVKP